MRGVKYTYTLNIPNDKQIIKEQLLMDDLVNDLLEKYFEYYHFKPHLSNNIIYNCIKRPNSVNALFKDTLQIKKCI